MRQITDGEKLISTYLSQLPLREINDIDEFLHHLYQKHEQSVIDEFLDILDARDEGGGENLFDFKNQTLALSLDIAHYATNVYRQYFSWFVKNDGFVPKRILDIGCENGIATCFYATLFPEAEVLGIDISQNAIHCANELAIKLDLRNVQFESVDARNLDKFYDVRGFDLITSLCTIQEIVGYFPDGNDESLAEISYTDIGVHQLGRLSSFMTAIHRLLHNHDSWFICCERFLGSNQILGWTRFVRHAGMAIDWMQSGNIRFHELNVKQQMPIFVMTKKEMNAHVQERDGLDKK